VAVIRADLGRPPVAGAAPVAASWAVVRASLGTKHLAWGLADAEGRATLMFPYPETPEGDSPPPLALCTWDITLAAWSATPAADAVVPARAVLSSVLAQPARSLWRRWSPVATDRVPLGTVQLRYGEELVVKSEGTSGRLLVG
jgi:hypothetical protein